MLDRYLHERGYPYTGPNNLYGLTLLEIDTLLFADNEARLMQLGVTEHQREKLARTDRRVAEGRVTALESEDFVSMVEENREN